MPEFVEVTASKKSLAKRKLLYGVGINDASYITHRRDQAVRCPYYRVWSNMMERCYSGSRHLIRPTYIGCKVTDEWASFTVFRDWMKTQDWQGKELDKDIKISGNKVYSPDTCLFVTSQINSLLNNHSLARGDQPIGVTFDKNSNKFRSQCSDNGRQKYLGLFSTPEEAHQVYIKYKKKVIIETANLAENLNIKPYLLKHAELLNK